MSVTKDKKTGKWMSQLRVKDWKGEEHLKKKKRLQYKERSLGMGKGISESSHRQLGHDLQGFHRTVYEGHGETAETGNGS